MNIFMKIVLVVAVVAILAGVVGGIINYNDHKAQLESGEYERTAETGGYKNNIQDCEDCDIIEEEDCRSEERSEGFEANGGRGRRN